MNNNRFLWNPEKMDSWYNVSIKTIKNTLNYDFNIKFIELSPAKEYVFCIRQNELLINNEYPESLSEQLIYKCSQIIYPLYISVKRNGEITEIKNIDHIKKRWKIIKPELLKYYKDDYSLLFIEKMQNTINSEDILSNFIINSILFYYYFQGYYSQFDNNQKREYIKYLGYQEFKFTQQVNNKSEKNNEISITTRGENKYSDEVINSICYLKKDNKNIEKIEVSHINNEAEIMNIKIKIVTNKYDTKERNKIFLD